MPWALVGPLSLALWLSAAPVLAAGPSFQFAAPQLQARLLAQGPNPFLFLARFAPGEEGQSFGVMLPRGTTEVLQVLAPPHTPPAVVTVLFPGGQEETLPTGPGGGTLWFGPLRLRQVTRQTLTATTGGVYGLLVQSAGGSAWQPYALAGNWRGSGLWNHLGWRELPLVPWWLLMGLLWRWN